ncbi:MAG: AMP-binding protein, partial [Proteobacteria bacterium]|nr:AMP-binding protein [Pseudomonadota bacterium]MBU1582636.1 AMP-binding protein [Pseudomonadota bacterium]
IKAKNNIETMIGYLTCFYSNVAVIFVDERIDDSLLSSLIKTYKPNFIWLPAQNEDNKIFTLGSYSLLFNEISDKSEPIHHQISLLLSTSGSTGSSKLIKLSIKNIEENALSIARYLNLNKKERPITCLPMHYSYGLSVINSHLLVGATILLTKDSVINKNFWQFFKENSATSISGVPSTYELLKTFGFFKMILPSLRYFTQAGGKLDSSLVKEFSIKARKKKIDFYVMYGQTEATARIAFLPPQYNLEKSESIGIPIPNGKLWLEGEDKNKIVRHNEIGEIIYQGPNVMMGYAHNRADLSCGDVHGDILRTNDLGYFDSDHFFYITGRANRYLKFLGNRFSLDEIENSMKSNGYNCVCGGKDNLLLVAATETKTLMDVKQEVVTKFKIQPSLIKLIEVEKFSTTFSRKINYREIFNNFL